MEILYTLCWLGFVILTAIAIVIAFGVMGGIAACMLSSHISQSLGEE